MATVLPTLPNQFFDASGNPLNGGKVYTYNAGTTTPRTTWSNASETTPNANPIILDAAGRATIFWRGNYKITVHTSTNVLVTTIDNVKAVGSVVGDLNVKDFGATGDGSTNDYAAVSAAITAAQTSNLALFFPPGTYMVGTMLNVTAPCVLFGAGRYLTKIKRHSGALTSVLHVGATTGTAQLNNVELRDLTFDGNTSCSDAVLKIRNVGASRFKDLFINGGTAIGLRTDTSTSLVASNQFSNEFLDIQSANHVGAGFLFQGEKLSRFDRLLANNNGGDGIVFKAWKYDGGTSAESTTCTLGSLASHTNVGSGVVFDQAEKYTIGSINATVNQGYGIRFKSTLIAASGNGSNSVQIGAVVLRNNLAGGIVGLSSDTALVAGMSVANAFIDGAGSNTGAKGIHLQGALRCQFGSAYISSWSGEGVTIENGAPLGVAGESDSIAFGTLILYSNGTVAASVRHGLNIQGASSNITVGTLVSSNAQTTGVHYEIATANAAGPIVINAALLKPVTITNAIATSTAHLVIGALKVGNEPAVIPMRDGVTAPSISFNNFAQIYVDAADGDLKIRFADGVVKTIVVDT